MDTKARTEEFENAKSQVGYCGIWCGSCVVGNGSLREMTKSYRDILDGYGVLHWGAKDFDAQEFLSGLQSIENIPVCAGCLKGGGRHNCEMRTCALSKGIDECSKCDTIAECRHAELLQHMRSGAVAAGLFVKVESSVDKQALIETWSAEVRSRFPCCILFTDD